MPEKPKKNRADVPTIEVPDWIDRAAWDGFIEMRIGKNKPPTKRALELMLKELEKFRARGQDPSAVLDQSTQWSWIGLYDLRRDSGANAPVVTVQNSVEPAADAVVQRMARARASAAWVEVERALRSHSMPLGGFEDARATSVLAAIGGWNVLNTCRTRGELRAIAMEFEKAYLLEAPASGNVVDLRRQAHG